MNHAHAQIWECWLGIIYLTVAVSNSFQTNYCDPRHSGKKKTTQKIEIIHAQRRHL